MVQRLFVRRGVAEGALVLSTLFACAAMRRRRDQSAESGGDPTVRLPRLVTHQVPDRTSSSWVSMALTLPLFRLTATSVIQHRFFRVRQRQSVFRERLPECRTYSRIAHQPSDRPSAVQYACDIPANSSSRRGRLSPSAGNSQGAWLHTLQIGMRHYADAEDAHLLGGFDAANYRWSRLETFRSARQPETKRRCFEPLSPNVSRPARADLRFQELCQRLRARAGTNAFAVLERYPPR